MSVLFLCLLSLEIGGEEGMTDHKRHTKGKRNEFNCAQLAACFECACSYFLWYRTVLLVVPVLYQYYLLRTTYSRLPAVELTNMQRHITAQHTQYSRLQTQADTSMQTIREAGIIRASTGTCTVCKHLLRDNFNSLTEMKHVQCQYTRSTSKENASL